MVVKSVDKPGQIGRIGSFMGTKNVSIIDIKIDEAGKNQLNISVVIDLTDRRILPEIIDGLKGIEGITDVLID